jgi:hypothetical protein
MDKETTLKILMPVFTFVLGLISKFLYDIWRERRTKKTMLVTKSIVTSFTREQLEENIRPMTEVMYSGHEIDSICVARVEIENNCSSPLRNQTCTVTFGDQATILGDPICVECTEDRNFVLHDSGENSNISRKFILMLLRPHRRIAWHFTVINHIGDFSVTHSIQAKTEQFEEADLDVEPIYSADKRIELSLERHLLRIASLLISIQIVGLIGDAFRPFIFGLDEVLRPITNGVQIWLWLLVIGTCAKSITPLMNWFREINRRDSTNSVEVSGSRNSVVVQSPQSDLRFYQNEQMDDSQE